MFLIRFSSALSLSNVAKLSGIKSNCGGNFDVKDLYSPDFLIEPERFSPSVSELIASTRTPAPP